MMTYKEHIQALEQKLKQEKELDKIMNYFLTHLGEQPPFLEECKPLKDHSLLRTFTKGHLKRLQEKSSSLRLFLSKPKGSHFVHGCFVTKKCSGTLIYFEKLHMGLLAQQPLRADGRMQYYRFSINAAFLGSTVE